MKSVPEFRLASRQMGRQALRIAVGIGDDPFLARLAAAVQDGRAAAHHATVFGAAVGREGADPERAATAYLYASAALLVGAGLRLIALGQLDGQRVLASMRGRIGRLAAAAATARADELWSFTPALEIAGIRHAALDFRLFRS
jgi:urease accessory protein